MLTLTFPAIDPVLIEVGPIAIRWYALSYIAGILLAWRYMIWLAKRSPAHITKEHVDDFVVWATLGIVFGGRLGYVIFYKAEFYLQNPLDAFAIWQGGMSFHGGLLGVTLATWLFCRRRGYSLVAVSDILACAAPLGLFLGRIANFINGELFGRVTDWQIGMVFPGGGPLPRHPSQLYEAFLEGLVLLLALFWLARRSGTFDKRGLLAGVFLSGYAIGRITAELFRQPDPHIGFLTHGTTIGQWLSLPLLLVGLWLIARSLKHEPS